MNIKSIAVYCASSRGSDPTYMNVAKGLGENIARRNINLIYGGAHVGLMGALATGALEAKGKVYGVIPLFLLKKELEHQGITKQYIVNTMHERKAKMAELADAIVAMPGGFGTMEELFEMLTWKQLALHQKPVALLNVNGFYDHFLLFIDKMVAEGFLKEEYKTMIIVEQNIEMLLNRIENYKPIKNEKWYEPRL